MQTPTAIGMKTTLQMDYEAVFPLVIDALKAEGFGVITEIDIKETFKKKLDVDFRPYKILGACNPSLSYRALTTAPDVGLLLPCNVTVEQLEDGRTQVSIIDPLVMMGTVPGDALGTIALETRERLSHVIAALER